MKSIRPPTTAAVRQRWISIFLFLAVFFLPLHFHVATASTALLNKECSCVHGSRTQLGQSAPPQASVPVTSYVTIFPVRQESFVTRSVSTHSSRAPPVL